MLKYLLAEYCPGPFYMGFWLYERDRNDGSPNDLPGGGWGWLHGRFDGLVAPRALVVSMGHANVPAVADYPPGQGEAFAEWFAATFPAGLLVRLNPDAPRSGGYYALVEVVGKVPRQVSRRIIRTVRRARASFARACAEDSVAGRET